MLVPLWYVYMDGALFFSTSSRSSKMKHLKRDPRVCCLIEEGEQWLDSKAVVISCEAHFVDAASEEATSHRAQSKQKYAAFRPEMKKAPGVTQQYCSTETSLIKLIPKEKEVRSWYNRKIKGFA